MFQLPFQQQCDPLAVIFFLFLFLQAQVIHLLCEVHLFKVMFEQALLTRAVVKTAKYLQIKGIK